MSVVSETSHTIPETGAQSEDQALVLDSLTLERLMEEVRFEQTTMSRHYNRTYNRHNR